MKDKQIILTGKERKLSDNDLIVSKTDVHGVITYVNHTFCEISGYSEEESLGRPHSFIRHPHMPRAVFKLLWDTIVNRSEIFAYVINLSNNGDHYWVFAHVTPTYNDDGKLVGYHSNRRAPNEDSVKYIQSIYSLLLKEESSHADPRKGLENSFAMLVNFLSEQKREYDEFVLSI